MKNTSKAKFKRAARKVQTSTVVMGDQLQYMLSGNLSTVDVLKLKRFISNVETDLICLKAALCFVQQAKINTPPKVTHLEVFLYQGKNDKVIHIQKKDHPSWPPTESELRFMIKQEYPKTKTFSAFFNNGNKLCEDAVVF